MKRRGRRDAPSTGARPGRDQRSATMNIVLIELLLVLGVALGLGIWQLIDVTRAQRADRERRPEDADE